MVEKIVNKKVISVKPKPPIKEVDFVTKAMAEYRMRPKSPPPRKIAKTPQHLELIDINKNNQQRRTMVNKLQAKK